MSDVQEYLGSTDPFLIFNNWFIEAKNLFHDQAEIMTLATATKKGVPSARIVLFKGLRDQQLSFVTDYRSRKSNEMKENPHVSLVFFWPNPMIKQVRILGTATKMKKKDSEEYFQSRPRGSQISAVTSKQSSPAKNRADMDLKVQEIETKHANKEIPYPKNNWGGFVVKPTQIEFWIGRENRFHDRFQFTLNKKGLWDIVRLWP